MDNRFRANARVTFFAGTKKATKESASTSTAVRDVALLDLLAALGWTARRLPVSARSSMADSCFDAASLRGRWQAWGMFLSP